jgi:sphingolipid 8-(E)-desaturase
MRLYQIGCIVEPWVNFTPPIRGGIFRLHPEQDSLDSSDDDLSDASTLDAFDTSHHDSNESSQESLTRQKNGLLAKIIRGEIDDNLRDYPSLDADTQRSIDLKFQALHQRVKEEGYYHCDYTEYAKELGRYGILFSCFFVALLAGWYLLSAAFLGLFWVSIMTGPQPPNGC